MWHYWELYSVVSGWHCFWEYGGLVMALLTAVQCGEVVAWFSGPVSGPGAALFGGRLCLGSEFNLKALASMVVGVVQQLF